MTDERYFIVRQRYFFLGVSIFAWLMGWMSIYFAFDDMLAYADDLMSIIFCVCAFFILSLAGPFSTIFVCSWKIEVKGNVLIVLKLFGLIRKNYTFDDIISEKVIMKSKGTIRIKFNDGLSLQIDPLSIGYNRFKEKLIILGLVNDS